MNSRQEAPIVNIPEKERTIVIIYNKPPNIITSHDSQDSRATVYEDIQSMRGFSPASHPSDIDRYRRENSFQDHKLITSTTFSKVTGIRSKLHAIGRLDADTTGLLLLTNDGRLVHHVTNPDAKIQEHEYYRNFSEDAESTKNNIKKTYQALIMGHHTEDSLRQIRYGVDIGKNYTTNPLLDEDDLQILGHSNHKSTVISITISEGKNRQVRKMFHAIGSGVMKLKRTRIGKKLSLGSMREGEWRVLTDNEVQRYLNWNPREIVSPASIWSSQRHNSRKGNSHKRTRRRRKR